MRPSQEGSGHVQGSAAARRPHPALAAETPSRQRGSYQCRSIDLVNFSARGAQKGDG